MPLDQVHERACTGDKVTIDTWRDTWLKNYKAAVEKFGNLYEKSAGKLYGINRHKPAICLASGPSLKDSIAALKMNKASKWPIMTVSTLHNYGYLEDEDVHADYYISLDSGSIVMDDVSESRNHDSDYYWNTTKGKTLIAFAASPPELFEKWQGEIYLFNCLLPEEKIRNDLKAIQNFNMYFSSGGNAGGSLIYFAKAVCASYSVMLCGYDFCFDYDDKFHSYPTKNYDKTGQFVMHPDIYGVPRKCFPSYINFKMFLDWMVNKIPGDWINCSGGILGSYMGGNIKQFQYMSLEIALNRFMLTERVWLDKTDDSGALLERKEVRVDELLGKPDFPYEMTVY